MFFKCWHCGAKKENPFGLCLKCLKFPATVHSKYIVLASNLDNLQKIKNDGRGVSCVKDIITYLNMADIESAIAVYNCDGDKICGIYPDLDQMICEGLNIEPRYGKIDWN